MQSQIPELLLNSTVTGKFRKGPICGEKRGPTAEAALRRGGAGACVLLTGGCSSSATRSSSSALLSFSLLSPSVRTNVEKEALFLWKFGTPH